MGVEHRRGLVVSNVQVRAGRLQQHRFSGGRAIRLRVNHQAAQIHEHPTALRCERKARAAGAAPTVLQRQPAAPWSQRRVRVL